MSQPQPLNEPEPKGNTATDNYETSRRMLQATCTPPYKPDDNKNFFFTSRSTTRVEVQETHMQLNIALRNSVIPKNNVTMD